MPKVIHFEIPAKDPERAIKFYKEVFFTKLNVRFLAPIFLLSVSLAFLINIFVELFPWPENSVP